MGTVEVARLVVLLLVRIMVVVGMLPVVRPVVVSMLAVV